MVLAVVVLFGGLLSLGAGVADRRGRQRIRAGGATAWALVCAAPTHPEYHPPAYRPLLRFQTDDGRSIEVFSPVAPTRRRPLVEGRKVLVHYDPADPTQVVLHGGRARSDLLFVGLGLAAIAGAVVAMLVA